MANQMKSNYFICRNITEVFRAEKSLINAGLTPKLVPAPPGQAGPCTTAIEIAASFSDEAVNILKQAGISLVKVIEEKDNFNELSGFLNDTPDGFFRSALVNILRGDSLNLKDIKVLLASEGEEQKLLWHAADEVRSRSVGSVVDIRSALEFSNYCRCNCVYCGLRRDNKGLPRYRMSKKEIIKKALEISQDGIQTIILQSGEDPWYTTARMIEIIRGIKETTGMKITLSLGQRQPWEYEMFREAGASNYLLKIETTDPSLYSEHHPGTSIEERMDHVRLIKRAGFITGCGNIIGLPGQDVEDIAKDIIWFKQEGIHMLGIGPFVPAPDTPLEKLGHGDVGLTLNTIAVSRLICKNSYIPSTTALATVDENAQLKGLACGANTIMLIGTPAQYRQKYQIYGNKKMVGLDWAIQIITALGRKTPDYIKREKVSSDE